MMYKIKKYDSHNMIILQKENILFSIPEDEANTDYQEYLKWVAEGNTAQEITE